MDNDFDLDVLSLQELWRFLPLPQRWNWGFQDASSSLPQFSNNYDFELMDVTGDGFLKQQSMTVQSTEHLFVGGPGGVYTDGTEALWPAVFNIGEDDNVNRFFDVDSDGHSDLFIGSLSGPDRVLTMNSDGTIVDLYEIEVGPSTPGTLDIALADLNGDNKLDWVQGQGEVGNESNHIYWGDDIPADTAPPHIPLIQTPTWNEEEGAWSFMARIHDGKAAVLL